MCVILSEPTVVVPLPYCAPPALSIHPYSLQKKLKEKILIIMIIIIIKKTSIYISFFTADELEDLTEQLTHVGAMASKRNARGDYVNIGAGRPPVPLRLAQRIKSGVFIEIADLLPERLGTKKEDTTGVSTQNDHSVS